MLPFSGTIEERGIAAWQNVDDPSRGKQYYVEGYSLYNIPLPARLRHANILKYLPFMPTPDETQVPSRLSDSLHAVILGKNYDYAGLHFVRLICLYYY